MIIDLTGSSLKISQVDIEADPDAYVPGLAAVDKWREFRKERMPTYSRVAAIILTQTAIRDTKHMQGILIQACPREIRSRVKDIIGNLHARSTTVAVSAAARSIVDLDNQVVWEGIANDDRTRKKLCFYP